MQSFWLLVGLIGLFWVGWALCEYCARWETLEVCGTLLAFCAGILLILFFVILPINRVGVRQDIAKYYAVKATIETARASQDNWIERAALSAAIIETNSKLVAYQYDNTIVWDWFVPDEVMLLEPLK